MGIYFCPFFHPYPFFSLNPSSNLSEYHLGPLVLSTFIVDINAPYFFLVLRVAF